jgi:hypothetical protein
MGCTGDGGTLVSDDVDPFLLPILEPYFADPTALPADGIKQIAQRDKRTRASAEIDRIQSLMVLRHKQSV